MVRYNLHYDVDIDNDISRVKVSILTSTIDLKSCFSYFSTKKLHTT